MTNEEVIKEIRQLYRGQCPSCDISKILIQHKCHCLLNYLPKFPGKEIYLLQKSMYSMTVKNSFQACKSTFEQYKYPYAIIKGPVLSKAVYGDAFNRFSSDLDILIRRKDIENWKYVLQANGFVQGRITNNEIKPYNRKELVFYSSATHQLAPFVKDLHNNMCRFVILDVNMEILWGESEEKSDMDFVLSHTREDELFNVIYRKLTPEMEFVSLCLHHYKDMNSLYLLSKGSLRLNLFCDIYDYLLNVRPNKQKILEICKHLQVGKYVYACLLQTNIIFDSNVITDYMDILVQYKDNKLIDTFGLNDEERKPWSINLIDRLFYPNLQEYLRMYLTKDELEKIQINYKMI